MDSLTVLAYFNAGELAEQFNAVAALTSSGTMRDMLRTVALVGGLTLLIGLALRRDQEPTEFLRWIVMVSFIQFALLMPKGPVTVLDRTGTQPPVVVANVPMVLGMLAAMSSRVGDTLTRAFEALSALPDDLKFQRHGLMFGNTVLVDTLQAAPVSPVFRDDLTRFVNNCTYYDILSGRIAADALATSGDIWTVMAATSSALRTPIAGAPSGSMVCTDAYALLSQRWNDEIRAVLKTRGRILNPSTINNAAAAALLDSQITASYAELTGIAATASTSLRQNMVLNAVRDSQMIAAQRLDSSSAAIVGATQAQAEMTANLQYMAMARVAERATPRIRSVIEIVCYFVFPIVICLMILAVDHAGKILKFYAMSIVWVQLIPPLYAILNFVMMRAGRPSLVGIATSADTEPAVNLQNIAQLSQQGLSDMAIAGYLTVLLPMIAWALVKSGEVGGAALFSAIGAPAGGAAASAATSLAAGNISQGNVSVDTTSANTVSAHHYDVAPSITSGFARHTTAAGSAIMGPQGVFRFQGNQSSLGFTANFGQKIGNALHQEASGREEVSKRETIAASEQRSAALADRMTLQKAYSEQHGDTHSDETGKASKATSTLAELNQIAETVNERLGLTSGSEIGRKIVGSIVTGVGVKGGIGKLFEARVGADSNTLREAGNREALDAATSFAEDRLKSRGITVDEALSDDFRHSEAFQWGSQLNLQSISSSEAALTKSKEHTENAERAKSEAFSLSRQANVVTDNWLHSSMNYEGYLASRLQQDNRLELFNQLYQSNPELAAKLAAGYLAETNFDVMPILPRVSNELSDVQEADTHLQGRTIASEYKRYGTLASDVESRHEANQAAIRRRGFKDVDQIESKVASAVAKALEEARARSEAEGSQVARRVREGKDASKALLQRGALTGKDRRPDDKPKPGSAADHQDKLHERLYGPDNRSDPRDVKK